MLQKVLYAYGINEKYIISPLSNGLINHTWKVKNENDEFILQRLNTEIFKQPYFIAENIRMVGDYLLQHYPFYFFCRPVKTLNGDDLIYISEEGYFRMFPFVKNSHSIQVVSNTKQAYEAAKKFGEFTKLLSGFPVKKLHNSLPDFHNLSLRFNQFTTAIKKGNQLRINKARELINFLNDKKYIAEEFELIKSSPDFKLRVTHHDTKISNVLFDRRDNGICVIDLDTLMPGYFISDVGDMIRTCVPCVNEEEKDVSKINIREEIFIALAEGYLSEMYNELTMEELSHFVYAGKFMIYMQALRFLSDYLNNDVYYGSAYKGQNFYRAANQTQLLKLLIENEKKFSGTVSTIAHKKL